MGEVDLALLSGASSSVTNSIHKATRTVIARKLKGLEDIISFSSVHWHMGDKGKRNKVSAKQKEGERERDRE